MITYEDKKDFKDKINSLIDELLNDEDLNYKLNIKEERLNGKITFLDIQTVNIENSMPNF